MQILLLFEQSHTIDFTKQKMGFPDRSLDTMGLAAL